MVTRFIIMIMSNICVARRDRLIKDRVASLHSLQHRFVLKDNTGEKDR